jgi:hypothetical protein
MATIESRYLKTPSFAFMSKSKLSVIFLILAYSFFADALSVSVSGVTSSAQDTTTPSKILINAGYALPSASGCVKDGVSTCNTCTGINLGDPNSSLDFPAPCNEHSIYDELTMTIAVESDKADFSTLPVGLATASDYSATTTRITNITTTAVNGRSYSVSATWTQWATALGINLACSAATGCGGTKTFYFGPIKDEKFAEYFTVVITYSVINYTSESTPLNGVTKALASMCPLTAPGSLTSSTKS